MFRSVGGSFAEGFLDLQPMDASSRITAASWTLNSIWKFIPKSVGSCLMSGCAW